MNKHNPEEEYQEAEILDAEVLEDEAPARKKPKKKKRAKANTGLPWSSALILGGFSIASVGVLAFIAYQAIYNPNAYQAIYNPNQRHQDAARQMEKNKERFIDSVKSTDDPAKAKQAYEEFAASNQKNLGKLAQASSGNQKIAIQIFQDFLAENEVFAKKWQTSFEALQDPRILDYTQLKNKGEFNYQKKIIKVYITDTKAYIEIYRAMIPNLTKRLAVIEPGSQFVMGMIDGATKTHQRQKPIFEKVMNQHLTLGNTLLEILDTLEKKQALWSVNNGQLQIDETETLNKINSLIETMEQTKLKIAQYSNELLETI